METYLVATATNHGNVGKIVMKKYSQVFRVTMSCLKTWSSLEQLSWAHFEILTKKFSEILILITIVWLIQEIGILYFTRAGFIKSVS